MGFHAGLKIKLAREIDGETQAELAERIADYTNDQTWTRAVIANIESGRKRITPDVLLPIAYVQNRSLEFYLVEPGARVPGTNSVNPGSHKRRLSDWLSPGQNIAAAS